MLRFLYVIFKKHAVTPLQDAVNAFLTRWFRWFFADTIIEDTYLELGSYYGSIVQLRFSHITC